jgi:hypothetical protein
MSNGPGQLFSIIMTLSEEFCGFVQLHLLGLTSREAQITSSVAEKTLINQGCPTGKPLPL